MTEVTENMVIELAREVRAELGSLNFDISRNLLPQMRGLEDDMAQLRRDLHAVSERLRLTDGRLARIEQRLCRS